MVTIRPSALPAASVVPSDVAIMIDDGSNVQKATPLQIFGALSYLGSMTASEALSAGSLVNIHASSGAKMRLADNTIVGKPADGFVITSVSNGGTGQMYGPGSVITGLSGLTAGTRYYLGAAGALTDTAPTSGVLQEVGVALSNTRLLFNPKEDHPL